MVEKSIPSQADTANDGPEPTDAKPAEESKTVLEKKVDEKTEPAKADSTDSEKVADPDDKAADDTAAEGKSGTSNARLAIGAAVGGVALAAAAASAVYFYVQFDGKKDVIDGRDAASAAACQHAKDLANFDYNNLDPYFGAVLDGATGEWKSQFESNQTKLRDVYTQGQVVSKATDATCAALSGGTDTAEVLVVVTESVANLATDGQPQLGQLAMTVNVDDVDGHWKVSKLNGPQLP